MARPDCKGASSDLVYWKRDNSGNVRFQREADDGSIHIHDYASPFILELELTWRCNLRCLHCYVDATEAASCKELSLTEIRKILKDAKELGMEELSLTGGEVFLRDDLPEILQAGHDAGFGLRFVTNGSLIDETWIKRLEPFAIKLVTISLDGVNPKVHNDLRGADCHSKTLTGMSLLQEAGIPVSVITAFSRPNLGEFDAIYQFCVDHEMPWQVQMTTAKGRCPRPITISPDEYYALGLKLANIIAKGSQIPVIPMDDLATFSRYEPLSLLSQTWQGGCSGGKLNLFVRADGSVTPCSALAFDEFIVGNIRKTSLKKLCRDAACGKCFKPWLTVEGLTGACAHCPHAFECRGGCPEILMSMCDGKRDNLYCYYRIEEEILRKETEGIW